MRSQMKRLRTRDLAPRRFVVVAGLTLLVLIAGACNRVSVETSVETSGEDLQAESQAAGSAPARGSESPASRPAGSDVTSLGPDAETRIYYQFIDDRGSVRFVERLDDVPEAWRNRVGYLEMDSPPPLSPADSQRVRDQRYEESGLSSRRRSSGSALASGGPESRAMDRFEESQILLYYADWCGYCKKAKRHLDGRSVEYTLLDVDIPAIKQELIAKTGQTGIPVIDVDGRIMKGYNASRLDQLIESL